MIELLTQEEAATFLKITPAKLEKLRLAGKVPYLPYSPRLYDRADIEDLQRRCPTAEALDRILKPERRPTLAEAEKWARLAVLFRRR